MSSVNLPGGESSRSTVRHLGGQTLVVMGGTLFTFVVGLPFQIYLAHKLGAAGLGVVGIAEAFIQTAAGFLAFGLAPLAMRFIPEYRVRGETKAIKTLVFLSLVVLGSVGLLGAFALPIIVSAAPAVFDISDEAQKTVGALALLLPITMVSFFLAQALRGFQEIRVVVFSTSILALSAKVAITLVIFSATNVSTQAYAHAIVISQALAIVPLYWALRRMTKRLPIEEAPAPIDYRRLKSFALTNYASGVMSSVIGNLDRIIIGAILGPAAVGVLMIVRQLQQFPTVFHQIVLTVISPVFAKLKAEGDKTGLAHQLHLANDWIFRLALGLILTLCVLGDYILGLYGAEFASQGAGLMLVMTLAVAINLATGPVGIILNMTGHHTTLFRISVFTALSTFVGYFIFIPIFGLIGAGYSVLLSYVFSNTLAIWSVKDKLDINWYDPRFKDWLLPIVGAIALLFVFRVVLTFIEKNPLAQAIVLISAIVLTYIVIFGINFLRGLHSDDQELIQAMKERFQRPKNRASSN